MLSKIPIVANILSDGDAYRDDKALLASQLVKLEANPNLKGSFSGEPPLLLATSLGHLDLVKDLLKAGADPNGKSDDALQTSALHAAVVSQNLEALNLLLESSANPEQNDKGGLTPLSLAIGMVGRTDFVEKMLDAGVSPDAKSLDGASILHKAVGYEQDTIAELILEKGGNPNMLDSSGETPLAMAVKNNNLRMATLLLNHQANPDHAGENGASARSYLNNDSSPEMQALILNIVQNP